MAPRSPSSPRRRRFPAVDDPASQPTARRSRASNEKLLTGDGYLVDPARDEEDAVIRAGRQHPDLILVSLAAPGSEVVATAVRIRHRAELSEEVRIVIFCVETIAEGPR